MKKYLAFVAAALVMVACDKTETPENYSLTLGSESLSFVAEGAAAQTVEVKAENVDWNFEIPTDCQEWLSAEKGDGILTVTVKDNTEEVVRNGSIKVVPASHADVVKARTIIVSQEAAGSQYVFELDKTELSFKDKDNEPQVVTVTADGEGLTWEMIVDSGAKDWVTAEVQGDKITINVADSEIYSVRTGRITVKPSVESLERIVITISQDACTTDPYFKATPLELNFKAIDKEPQIITIDKFGCTYTTEIVVDESVTSWFSPVIDDEAGEISITVDRNIAGARTAQFLLKPDQGLEVVTVTINQEGNDSSSVSTLTGDVELPEDAFATSSLTIGANEGDDYLFFYLYFRTEGVGYDQFGHLGGTGHNLNMKLVANKVEDDTVIPDGTYNVDSYKELDPDGFPIYHTPTVIPGEFYREGYYGETFYQYFDNDVEVEASPLFGGSVTVSHEGEGKDAVYTIEIKLTDDAQNTVSGTFHGAFSEYQVNRD